MSSVAPGQYYQATSLSQEMVANRSFLLLRNKKEVSDYALLIKPGFWRGNISNNAAISYKENKENKLAELPKFYGQCHAANHWSRLFPWSDIPQQTKHCDCCHNIAPPHLVQCMKYYILESRACQNQCTMVPVKRKGPHIEQCLQDWSPHSCSTELRIWNINADLHFSKSPKHSS